MALVVYIHSLTVSNMKVLSVTSPRGCVEHVAIFFHDDKNGQIGGLSVGLSDAAEETGTTTRHGTHLPLKVATPSILPNFKPQYNVNGELYKHSPTEQFGILTWGL